MRAIPHYTQTSGFSCGAASLVMALAALRGAEPSRGLEYELWREATMVGVPGIDQWGLAVPALRRGVAAVVVSETETTFPSFGLEARKRFTEEQIELTVYNQRENRARAEAAGVRWERRAPTPDDVERALADGRVPVLLVDLLKLGDFPAPHWVVVGEAADGTWVVHDPDPDGPGVRKLAREAAWATTDVSEYGAKPTLVVLGP